MDGRPCVEYTVRREEVAVIDRDAEHVFMEVPDRELHRRVPLGIQTVCYDLRLVLLGAHRNLTVRVTLT